MKWVKIIDKVLDKKYWEKVPERYYLSGHMHRHSPIETDDSCGNCDGANCDDCHKVVVPEHFELCIDPDDLYGILKEKIPNNDEACKELAYGDKWFAEGYRCIYPIEAELKEYYPEFYKELCETC